MRFRRPIFLRRNKSQAVMFTQQQQRAREIYFALLDLDTPHERADFIERECHGHAGLQSAVVDLLEAHEANGSFLESPLDGLLEERHDPAVAATMAMQKVTEQPGSRIGRYKLLQQIGEGGFGVVYMAEQEKPVRRKVALKIIKPGMDTREVIARFEAERQALALMDHPCIAKVLDAGTTGEPGASATGGSGARTPVAHAPGSPGRPYFVMELVRGVPITEFCDENRLTTRERLELFVAVCRAVQHAHQKGIIHRDLKPSNVMVTMNDDKPMPKVIDFGISKALSQQLTEKTLFTAYGQIVGTPLYMSPEQAQYSGLDVDTRSDVYSLGVLLYELLTGGTPFDKETLQKSGFDEMRRIIREVEPPRPSARISTLRAEALSAVSDRRKIDGRKLNHALRGELDWIVMKALEKDRNRRYESASSFAADVERYLADETVQACPPSVGYRLKKFARRHFLVILTVTSVAALTIAGVTATLWQAMRANEEATYAKAQSRRANANLRLAITVVDSMYTEVAETSLRRSPRSEEYRRRILEKALEFYLMFAKENHDRALDYETAMAWRRVGEMYHRLERNDKSIDALMTAIATLQMLVKESPHDYRYQRDLASTFWFLSKPLEVEKRFDESQAYCRKALAIQSRLAREFPAEIGYKAAIATTYHQLGHVILDANQSIAAFTTSRQWFEQLHDKYPANPHFTRQLAHVYAHLGRLYHEAGRVDEAEAVYRRSITLVNIAKGMADADVVDSYQAILGGAYRNWGILMRETDRLTEAEDAHQRARRSFRDLTRSFPAVVYYEYQLAKSHIELGKTLAIAKKRKEANAAIAAACDILTRLAQRFPENPSYRRLRITASTLRDQGRRTDTRWRQGLIGSSQTRAPVVAPRPTPNRKP